MKRREFNQAVLASAVLASAPSSALAIKPKKRKWGLEKDLSGKKIAVIGAGISGLTAAHFLQEAKAEVTVIESNQTPGGRMSTLRKDDWFVDRGAQIVGKDAPLLSHFLKKFDMEDELMPIDSSCAVYSKSDVIHASISNPLSLLKTINPRDIRFGKVLGEWNTFFQALRAIRTDDFQKWAKLDDQSVEEYLSSLIGQDAVDKGAGPMMKALFFQDADEISRTLFFAMMVLLGKKAHVIKSGIGVVPDRLAKDLNVEYGKSCFWVRDIGDSVQVLVEDSVREFDHAVLAVPAPIAKRLYETEMVQEQALLDSEYVPVMTVAARYEQATEDLSTGFGAAFHDELDASIWALELDTRVLSGKRTMKVFPVERFLEENWAADGETVMSALSSDLSPVFPGIESRIESVEQFRFKNGIVRSKVGTAKAIASYQNFVREARPKVLLAGDYCGISGTEGASQAGYFAAESID